MSDRVLTADELVHKGNMEYAMRALSQGYYARLYGQVMSDGDKKLYDVSKELAKIVLVKQYEKDVSDQELIEGLEGYIRNLTPSPLIPLGKGEIHGTGVE